jgi:hypothetical protein
MFCLWLVTMKKVLIYIHDVSGVKPFSENYTVLYTVYSVSLTTQTAKRSPMGWPLQHSPPTATPSPPV